MYNYNSLRGIFYNGRTQYLAGRNPALVTIDPAGRPWVVDDGTLTTRQEDKWIARIHVGFQESMIFDADGNMWTVAQAANVPSGLGMFDGKKWNFFTTRNSGLASNHAYHLALDQLDRLWITYDYGGELSGSGVSVFDGNTWTTFTTKNSGLPTDEVTAIAFDAENLAWFGTTHGLSIFDGNKWITYSPGSSGLVGEAISAIAFDQQDRAWIVTGGNQRGINIFDGKEWVYYSLEEIGIRYPSSLSGTGIFIDPQGRIWIQNNGDVRIFDGKSWIGLAEDDGYNNNVGSLASDKQGNIWIGNGNGRGLVVLDSNYALASAWQTQPQRTFFSSGGIWYVAFILACLCIAILRDTMVPVALALLSGIASILGWMVLFKDPHLLYFFPLPFGNPGIYATLGATLGVFADIRRSIQAGTARNWRLAIRGFYAGWAIGLLLAVPLMFAQ